MNKTQRVHMLFARQGMEITVPKDASILRAPHPPALSTPEKSIRQTLLHPLASAPLADLLARKKPKTVTITISDITRPVPNKLLLPALLETLNAHGIPDSQVTILIGTGMHRPSTPAEHLELVGPDILQRCPVIDHHADDPATLVKISDEPPVSVNKIFLNADFRIVTGLIEPHFMAGYSGGRKGICPALVDLQTVQRFHGPVIMGDLRSAEGILDGNPCNAESLRIARLVGCDFLVNVAINGQRQLAGVYAGDMEKAHLAGIADVARWTSAPIDQPFDLIITNGGGYPLDLTFYQTVKGMVTALPACHPGSTLLIASGCQEGIGSQSYADMMLAWSGRWPEFLTHIAGNPVKKDQWQAQMQCRVLNRIGVERLWLASDGLPLDIQSKLWLTPLPGPGTAAQRTQSAIDRFLADHPAARVAVIPEGPYTMLRPGA